VSVIRAVDDDGMCRNPSNLRGYVPCRNQLRTRPDVAERRDYLLRMIEQMGSVFARIRQMILGGSTVTEEELRSAASRAGADLGVVRALDADSLVNLLSTSGEVDPTRTWVMAELLYVDALAEEVNGEAGEALDLYAKSLRLYTAIDPRIIGGIPEGAGRIAEIEERITTLRAADPTG
jgi:hypothetical protein